MRVTQQISAKRLVLAIVAVVILVSCQKDPNGFTLVKSDRTISGNSKYPTAVEPAKVGTYPPTTASGAGYFYDDVLEYRVWLHPDKGAFPLNRDKDYFYAFAEYERAEAFSKSRKGSEEPLVLVRQREWIDEPNPHEYHPRTDERITEWRVEWLADDKRQPNSIKEFLQHPKPMKTDEADDK